MSAPRPHHRADVQGLRAVAVLLVVAYHADLPVPGGFAGVDVFFAISGFVIAHTLLRELEASGRIRLGAFYARRVRRLLPALAVLLVAVAALGTLASPLVAQRDGALTGVAASFSAANAYLASLPSGYFDPAATLNPLLHTWTLAVEEQFYLAFPLLLLGGWLLARRAAALALVALVTAGSFALALAWNGGALGFYSAPARAWEFGAGALVALAAPALARLPRSGAALLGAAGLAGIAFTAFGVRHGTGDPQEILVAVLGTCALLAAAAGPAARLLALRPAVWVGDRSYGIYLWHWPLIVFARALWPETGWAPAAAALVAFVPAWLSYRYVEQPIRLGPRFRGRRVLALAGACVAVPVAASAALLAVHGLVVRSDAVREWEAVRALHADQERGCADLGACTWTTPGARGLVALVGDSQAGQFTEPLLAAARTAGYDVAVATVNSCPLAGLRVAGTAADPAACARFNDETLGGLERLRPDVVLLASRSDYYVSDPTVALGEPGARSAAAKERLWRDALGATIARLNRAGAHVVVVHPVPRLTAAPLGCSVLAIVRRTRSGSVGRAASERAREAAIRAERAAVAAARHATAVDFDDALCRRSVCRGARGRTWTYRDVSHLSVAGSLLLTERFERLLRAAT